MVDSHISKVAAGVLLAAKIEIHMVVDLVNFATFHFFNIIV